MSTTGSLVSDEISALIDRMFLARVPALICAGLPINEAIAQARAADDDRCVRILEGSDALRSYLLNYLCERVYHRLRQNPVEVRTTVSPKAEALLAMSRNERGETVK
jgi:hypothetical protein